MKSPAGEAGAGSDRRSGIAAAAPAGEDGSRTIAVAVPAAAEDSLVRAIRPLGPTAVFSNGMLLMRDDGGTRSIDLGAAGRIDLTRVTRSGPVTVTPRR